MSTALQMDCFTAEPLLKLLVVHSFRVSLVAQTVKNLPTMWETWVPTLGWEDRLEEDMRTYSNILAWRISMDRGPWWTTVHGVIKSWTQLSD